MGIYETISGLCQSKGISGYRMCKDIGIQPSIMTDLKSGRKKGLSAAVANKIAAYFHVSVGYLLGTEEQEKPADTIGALSEEELAYIRWFRHEATEKEKALVRMIVEGEPQR